MNFSGNILLLTTTLLFAISFATHDFFYRWEFFLILALVSTIIVSFKTVTTRIKLSLIKKIKEVDREVSIEIA